jgi:hypothetical protein
VLSHGVDGRENSAGNFPAKVGKKDGTGQPGPSLARIIRAELKQFQQFRIFAYQIDQEYERVKQGNPN